MSYFLASPKNLLSALAALLLIAYLILFARLVVRYPNDGVILRSDRTGKRSNLLFMPIVLAAVLAPMPYRAVAVVVGLPLLVGLAWSQHLRLARVGASPAFLRKLAAVSCVALAAMLAFGATMLHVSGS